MSSRSNSRSVSLDYSKSEEMMGKNEEKVPLTQHGMPKSSKFLVAFTFILFVLIVGLAIGVLIVGDIGRIFKNQQDVFNQKVGEWLNVRPALLMKPTDSVRGYETFGLPIVVDQWKKKADMPIARSDHQVVSVGSNIYIIGGSGNNGIGSNSTFGFVDVYDSTADTWSQLTAKLNHPRYRFASAVFGASIFIFGGRGDNDVAFNFVETLNTASGVWVELPPMPTPRSDMTAVTVGNKIYVIGGYSSNYTYLSTVEAFDVQLSSWETVAPMNIPRGDVHAVAIDDSILVAAGYTDGVTLARTLEQYFPNRDTWIVRDDIPVPRGDKGVAVLNGEYYTVAGEVSFFTGNGTFSKAVQQVESYNPSTGVWTARATYPLPAFRLGCASVSNKIYCFGGHTCNVVKQSGCVSFSDQDEVAELATTYEYSAEAYQFFRPLDAPVLF